MSKRQKPAASWSVPIYTGVVHLFTDWDSFTAHAKKLGAELRENPPSGMSIAARNKRTNERVYLLGVFDSTLQTAVHEMAHVAMLLLEDVGVQANDGNGEPYCYLLDSMWARFEKTLCEHVVDHG